MKTSVDPIKLIIADDHEVLREGISSIVMRHRRIKVVAEASNGQQLVQLTDQLMPDVILADIQMPGMDGIEATRIISNKHPQVGIIALSMFDDDKFIMDMLEAGAKGYLMKNANRAEIIEAIETVSNLEPYFCRNISVKMMKLIAENHFTKRKFNKIEFTANEKQVIDLICRQFFTKEISRLLHLSPRTIEGYRVSILKKMNARNSIGIVLYAVANNLYDPSGPAPIPGNKK